MYHVKNAANEIAPVSIAGRKGDQPTLVEKDEEFGNISITVSAENSYTPLKKSLFSSFLFPGFLSFENQNIFEKLSSRQIQS